MNGPVGFGQLNHLRERAERGSEDDGQHGAAEDKASHPHIVTNYPDARQTGFWRAIWYTKDGHERRELRM